MWFGLEATYTSRRTAVIASTPETAQGIVGSPKLGQQVAPIPSLSPGTELIGEYQGSGFKEPVFLVRRGDGQMIQLSRLLYLVATETDGHKDLGQIAQRVSTEFG